MQILKTHYYAQFIFTQISIQLALDTRWRYRFVLALFFNLNI